MKTFLMALGVAGAIGIAATALPTPHSLAAEHGGMMEGMGGMHGMGGMGGMPGMSPGEEPVGDDSVSSLAFKGVNDKMHRAMAIPYSGNADVDFVRGMIPHHQGAIDMAKIVVAFGEDAEIRKLAEDIVKAQENEIALMQAWLKAKGQ